MRTTVGVWGSVVVGILVLGVSAIGTAHAQTPAPGTFAAPPVFSDGGLAAVVFNGGTPAQLESATLQVGGTGVWVQDSSGTFAPLVGRTDAHAVDTGTLEPLRVMIRG